MPERIPGLETQEIPKTVLDYIQNKRETILNEYRTPDGKYSESCLMLAFDLAKLLIEAGREPYIAMVSKDIQENGYLDSKELKPKMFNKTIWFTHHVCCCDGKVFDPLLEQPVAIGDYAQTVFGEKIEMQVLFPFEKVVETLKRKHKD
jgi:hypothetical protein